MIVVVLKNGYLSKDMNVVTSMREAAAFSTKKQAERKVLRAKKKNPDMDMDGVSYEPLCATA